MTGGAGWLVAALAEDGSRHAERLCDSDTGAREVARSHSADGLPRIVLDPEGREAYRYESGGLARSYRP